MAIRPCFAATICLPYLATSYMLTPSCWEKLCIPWRCLGNYYFNVWEKLCIPGFLVILFLTIGRSYVSQAFWLLLFHVWEKLCIPGGWFITAPHLGEVMYPRWLVYYCSTFGRSYVSQVVSVLLFHIWEKLCIPGV